MTSNKGLVRYASIELERYSFGSSARNDDDAAGCEYRPQEKSGFDLACNKANVVKN